MAAPDREVSLTRLYLMRALCVFVAAWGFLNVLPGLMDHEPDARGVFASMVGGLWIVACFGIRYPLQILPLFLLEFTWKSVWFLAFGLPQWISGVGSPQLKQDLMDIGAFPLVMAVFIPWGYVWRHYVKAPGERWR